MWAYRRQAEDCACRENYEGPAAPEFRGACGIAALIDKCSPVRIRCRCSSEISFSGKGLVPTAVVNTHCSVAAMLEPFLRILNNRKNPHLFRDTLKRLLSTEPLPFEKLTTKAKAAA